MCRVYARGSGGDIAAMTSEMQPRKHDPRWQSEMQPRKHGPVWHDPLKIATAAPGLRPLELGTGYDARVARRASGAGSRCKKKMPGEADLQDNTRLVARLVVKMKMGSCG